MQDDPIDTDTEAARYDTSTSHNNEIESAPVPEGEAADANVPAKWTKGMASPNPKGRPPVPKNAKEVKALARQYTVMAVETLAKIAANPKAPPPSRVAAAEGLLARAWGRAPTTDLEAAEGLMIQIVKFSNPQLEDDNIKTIEGAVNADDQSTA